MTNYTNGGVGNDVIDVSAIAGAQQVQGRAGNDVIVSGSSDDKLYGNEGNDVIRGGGGKDVLTGGEGADTFIFAKSDLSPSAVANISDFEGAGTGLHSSHDKILLTGFTSSATFTLLRQSGTAHVYQVKDGLFLAQIQVTYAGTLSLAAGDFEFANPSAPPPNLAPIVSGAHALIPDGTEGTLYFIRTADLTQGYADPEGEALQAVNLSSADGIVSLAGSGAYSFLPNPGYIGNATINYDVLDGHGRSIAASETVRINHLNHAPYDSGLPAHPAIGVEDQPYTFSASDLLSPYKDADADTLVISALWVSQGAISSNPDGTYTVGAPANFAGEIALRYEVSDGHGGVVSGASTLTLLPANDAPTAQSDTLLIGSSAGSTVTMSAASLLANDSDIDGDKLFISNVGSAAHGSVTYNTNGTSDRSDDFIVYKQAQGYSGTDSFSYVVSDGSLISPATVSVSLVTATTAVITYTNGGAGNDVINQSGAATPQQIQGKGGNDVLTGGAGEDKISGNEGDDVLNGGLGKDVLTGGAGADTFIISRADMAAGFTDSIADFEGAGNGFVTGEDLVKLTGFSSNATLSLVRQSGTTHVYQVKDGSLIGQFNVSYAGSALLVAGDFAFAPEDQNHAPAYNPTNSAVISGLEDQNIAISVSSLLAGYIDSDGDQLNVSTILASHGSIVDSGSGVLTFTPQADFNGQATISYNVTDGHGGTLAAAKSIIIAAANDAPVANDDMFVASSMAGHPLVISVSELIQNDRDADNDAITVLGIGLDAAHGSVSGVGGAEHGTAIFFDNGTLDTADDYISYMPTSGFLGKDTFSYTITDGTVTSIGSVVVTSVPAKMSSTPLPAGALGSPAPSIIQASENHIVSGMLGAFVPAEIDSGFSVRDTPLHGTLKLDTTGEFFYAPDVGFVGTDSFKFTAVDKHGGVQLHEVDIHVATDAAEVNPLRNTSTSGDHIFVQRFDGTGSFYVGGEAVRVTRNGDVVVDWTTDGVLLGIPQGDGYTLETRSAGNVVAQVLSIGTVVVAAGQSNMLGWFTAPTSSELPHEGVYVWMPSADYRSGVWSVASGAGTLAFATTFAAANPGVPLAFIAGAVGGTSLLQLAARDYWAAQGPGTLYQNLEDQAAVASHGQSEYLIWNQGEADSAARVSPAVYETALEALLARFQHDLGGPHVVISGLGIVGGNADELRQAQSELARDLAGVTLVVTSPQIETDDGTHLTTPGRILQGTEVALSILQSIGMSDPNIAMVAGDDTSQIFSGSSRNDIIRAGGGSDVVSGGAGDDIVRAEAGDDTVMGEGGNDALSGGLGKDLVNGGVGNDDVYGDGGDDFLLGAEGNDTVSGGSGNDVLDGGIGADIIIGGDGVDILVGGEGADCFVFQALTASTVSAPDRILDFNDQQGDFIDLTAVDGNTLVAGRQSFSFIGNAEFHHIAGELRYQKVSAGVLVSGDANGDGTADFAILLANITQVTAADFHP